MSDIAFEFLKEELIPNDLRMPLRKKAFSSFRSLGYPNRKSEAFRYIPLAKLYAHDFEIATCKNLQKNEIEQYIIEGLEDSYLVLINGKFDPALSKWDSRISINSLNGAMSDYAIFLQNRLQVNLKNETNPFAFLNASFHENGIFIYLPKNLKIEKPLQIINLTDNFDNGPSISFPRIHACLGQNAEISIIHTTNQVKNQRHLCMPYIDCVIEKGAKLTFNDIANVSNDYWYLADYRFLLKSGSEIDSVDFSQGSKTIRRDYRVVLTEEDAKADLRGLNYLKEEKSSHTNILIEHLAPNCTSSQLFKYVLDDGAKSSFEGKIYVTDIAQKTEAYQLNKNLILSDNASAYSKPNLEIFADDVKASHGATFGKLSDTEMFYLKSRGIEEKKAKQMMIKAFCVEILEKLIFPPSEDVLC